NRSDSPSSTSSTMRPPPHRESDFRRADCDVQGVAFAARLNALDKAVTRDKPVHPNLETIGETLELGFGRVLRTTVENVINKGPGDLRFQSQPGEWQINLPGPGTDALRKGGGHGQSPNLIPQTGLHCGMDCV